MRKKLKLVAIPALALSLTLSACASQVPDPASEGPQPGPVTSQNDQRPVPANPAETPEVGEEPSVWEEREILDGFLTPPNTRLLGEPEESTLEDVRGWSATLEISVGTNLEELEENLIAQLKNYGIKSQGADLNNGSARAITGEGEIGEMYERFSIELIPPTDSAAGTMYWLAAKTPVRAVEVTPDVEQ